MQVHSGSFETERRIHPRKTPTMIYDNFAGWVRSRIDSGPYRDVSDAARQLGIPPSTLYRWLGAVRFPTRATIREAATILDAPIHEVLVAAGYMQPEECYSTMHGVVEALSSDELRAELMRRESTDRGRKRDPA